MSTPQERIESNGGDGPNAASDAEKATAGSQDTPQESSQRPTLKEKLNKPLSFHLAFLSLLIMVFIVSVDATALAVAISVGLAFIQ